jgi:DNA-directed RNA polymerase I, II, and III subunit RPABC2
MEGDENVGYEGEENEEELLDEGEILEEEEALRPVIPDPLKNLYKYHPESILDYADAIKPKVPLQVATQSPGDLKKHLDDNHRTQPFLSVFERTKILGFRANQLSQGARPYILVPEHVSNVLEIAKLELEQRRLPFIVKRPLPDGTFEYWRLSDLMLI